MALRKEMKLDEILNFELSHSAEGIHNLTIKAIGIVGRTITLLITANKEAVPIEHIKTIGSGNEYFKTQAQLNPRV